MSEPRGLYDIWIVDLNRVYRDVPFTVVGDWVQQGRLLENDRVRPSGTNEWFALSTVDLFTPYFPRPATFRAEDKAEALEKVEMDVQWKRRGEDPEEDVDMIPLIDISLVLLIFFMMTAGTLLTSSLIDTPEAESSQVVAAGENNFVVGVRLVGRDVKYYVGEQVNEPLSTEADLMREVEKRIKGVNRPNVILKAGKDVPFKDVQGVVMRLQARGIEVRAGVRDKTGG